MSTETPQKIYIADQDNVLFECPKCHVYKEADVSKYKKTETLITLKIKCRCGNIYPVILEKRKYYRKKTKLPGKFSFRPLEGQEQLGMMTVLDVSKGGLRFQMTTVPVFKSGDIIELEFKLDNKLRTPIKKLVYVRNIRDKFVNVEFCVFDTRDSKDKALGFYLY